MINVNEYFKETRNCTYKGESYSVRDNGAVLRHQREGKRRRKLDEVWTFGTPAENGYMLICGESVHRIVATAFLGEPENDQLIVDHIDTNRKNNRPENLRWITKLENVLNNPITRQRIEYHCGSVEAFLKNPSILNGLEKVDSNFGWMRTVSPEEAAICLKRLNELSKKPINRKEEESHKLDEWIYKEQNTFFSPSYPPSDMDEEETEPVKVKSLTPNAVQVDWKTPTEFPCCPMESSIKPLEEYKERLKPTVIFSKNIYTSSLVVDSALVKEGNELWVMCQFADYAIKPWTLTKITFENGVFVHQSKGSFFHEDGAQKYFTLAQGKEWTGGDVFDDYC